jgi:hypothetical protein
MKSHLLLFIALSGCIIEESVTNSVDTFDSDTGLIVEDNAKGLDGSWLVTSEILNQNTCDLPFSSSEVESTWHLNHTISIDIAYLYGNLHLVLPCYSTIPYEEGVEHPSCPSPSQNILLQGHDVNVEDNAFLFQSTTEHNENAYSNIVYFGKFVSDDSGTIKIASQLNCIPSSTEINDAEGNLIEIEDTCEYYYPDVDFPCIVEREISLELR